jgi:hypothetical protein
LSTLDPAAPGTRHAGSSCVCTPRAEALAPRDQPPLMRVAVHPHPDRRTLRAAFVEELARIS